MEDVEVRRQVARIVSEAFRGPSLMTRFLEGTVERTLAGQTESLKEYTIGAELLNRGPGFDPRVDSVVRVTAARLRSKLEDYYAGPGKQDPILIEYPPGGYVPVISRRSTEAEEQAPAASEAALPAPAPRPASAWRRYPGRMALVAVTTVALAVGGFRGWRQRAVELEIPRFRFQLPDVPNHPPTPLSSGGHVAVSPDGSAIAYVTRWSGGGQLRIVSLSKPGRERVLQLPGVIWQPFWSPDGANLAFFSMGRLHIVTQDLNPVATLCDPGSLGLPAGGTWSRSGVIVVARPLSPLFRVTPKSGTCQPILPGPADQSSFFWPSFLPDGEHLLYTHFQDGRQMESVVNVISLDAPDRPVPLFKAHSPAIYTSMRAGQASGALLFANKGSLWALRFDPATLTVSGEPWMIEEQVGQYGFSGAANFSVAPNGVLAVRSGQPVAARQLIWVGRDGKRLGEPLATGLFRHPGLSPDGRQVAVERIESSSVSESDIWLLSGGEARRLTLEPGLKVGPVWFSDGKRILYGASNKLWVKEVDGGEPARELPGVQGSAPQALSVDQRRLSFSRVDPSTDRDVCLAELEDGATSPKVSCPAATSAGEYEGQISPNGKWLVFRSNEQGPFQMYLTRVDGAGVARLQVSPPGRPAYGPKWRRDGKELFYVDAVDHKLMSVPVVESEGRIQLGRATALFPAPFYSAAYGYAAAPDGTRFLFSASEEAPSAEPIRVILNAFGGWTDSR